MDLAKEQKLNYGDDITSVLRQARKRRFQMREEQRIAQDIELQTYLNQLIIDDAKRSLTTLQEQESAKDSDAEAGSAEFANRKEEIEEKRDSCISRLNDLFAKVDERRRVRFLLSSVSLFFRTNLEHFASCGSVKHLFIKIYMCVAEKGSTRLLMW